jgi:hypothetical protein
VRRRLCFSDFHPLNPSKTSYMPSFIPPIDFVSGGDTDNYTSLGFIVASRCKGVGTRYDSISPIPAL